MSTNNDAGKARSSKAQRPTPQFEFELRFSASGTGNQPNKFLKFWPQAWVCLWTYDLVIFLANNYLLLASCVNFKE